MRPGNCIAAAYRKLQSLQFALNEQLNTNTQPLLSQAAKTEQPPRRNRPDRKRRPRPVCIPFPDTLALERKTQRTLSSAVPDGPASLSAGVFLRSGKMEYTQAAGGAFCRGGSPGTAAALRQGPQNTVRQPPLASTTVSSTASHALSADGLYTAPQSAVKRSPRRSCR